MNKFSLDEYGNPGNFSREPDVPVTKNAMKAYFNNLPMRTWLLLVVPAIMVAYALARLVLPAVVHAVLPEAVRAVLSTL